MAISGQKEGNSASDKPVQDRLFDAAEQLFSEHGFEGTSVRDIAATAGCNIAAVNYYFGSKDKLYTEVWRRQLVQMRDARIASIEKVMSQSGGNPRLEDLLSSYANAFLEPLVDESRGRRFIKLMTREMVDRHLPENMFVEELIIPTVTVLREALLRACPRLEQSKVWLVILSVVGQLIHVLGTKTMFEQTDNPELPEFDLNELVNHIVKFSAAGIRAYAEGKTE